MHKFIYTKTQKQAGTRLTTERLPETVHENKFRTHYLSCPANDFQWKLLTGLQAATPLVFALISLLHKKLIYQITYTNGKIWMSEQTPN